MLRTNSKQTREKVKAYIIENCQPDNYIGYSLEESPTTWEEVKNFIVSAFNDEMGGDKSRRTHQQLFIYWCSGLPSALNTDYYYNRSAVEDLGTILEESDDEKNRFTETQAKEMLTRLIYRELFH